MAIESTAINEITKPLVVITGASTDFGVVVAEFFSASGHPLLLLGNRLEMFESLQRPNIQCCKVDVNDAAAVRAAINKAEKQYGPVDCLVNNAGLMQLDLDETQDTYDWHKVYNVNVLALLNSMQAVLGDMKARNQGSIININSIAGEKAFPSHGAYCRTKFALSVMSENAREEVAETDVRVMTICQGAVESGLQRGAASQEGSINDDQNHDAPPSGVLVADDIARAVIFMYQQPQNVNIHELVITATRQKAL